MNNLLSIALILFSLVTGTSQIALDCVDAIDVCGEQPFVIEGHTAGVGVLDPDVTGTCLVDEFNSFL